MLHVYIDTALLAVPNYGFGLGGNVVQQLIDRVTRFSLVISEDVPVKIVVTDELEDLLGAFYPTPDSIGEFLEMEGLSHNYSANDIWKEYLTIIDRAERPSSLGTFEVHQASSFSAAPPLPPGLGPVALAQETQRVFATVAVQVDDQRAWWIGSALAGTAEKSFDVVATVDSASHNPSPVDGPLSFTFARSVRILESINELVDFSSALRLWQCSRTGQEAHMAISLGALALRKSMFPSATINDLKPFSIGIDFIPSLQAHQCARAQNFSATTFELCSQIVADIGVANPQPMGRPQQEIRPRDSAGAYRSHINGGGQALRLMYWQTPSEIEFANVGNKKELVIEQGVAGSQVRSKIGFVLEE